jgi:hypothetical protein
VEEDELLELLLPDPVDALLEPELELDVGADFSGFTVLSLLVGVPVVPPAASSQPDAATATTKRLDATSV